MQLKNLGVLIFLMSISLSLHESPLGASKSVNCDRATTPVENTICNSVYLPGLDFAMSFIYRQALEYSKNPLKLKAEQGDWLKNRPSDEEQLRKEYEARIEALLKEKTLNEELIHNVIFTNKVDDLMDTKTSVEKLPADYNKRLYIVNVLISDLLKKKGLIKADDEESMASGPTDLLQFYPDTYLLIYSPFMAAYQANLRPFTIKKVRDELNIQPISFPTYSPKEKRIIEEKELGGLYEFNIKLKILSILSKDGYILTRTYTYKVEPDKLILIKQVMEEPKPSPSEKNEMKKEIEYENLDYSDILKTLQ